MTLLRVCLGVDLVQESALSRDNLARMYPVDGTFNRAEIKSALQPSHKVNSFSFKTEAYALYIVELLATVALLQRPS